MLERIAHKIAVESGKDEEIILYGLTILSNTFFGYLVLIITSYIFGLLQTALTAALTASIFRVFTGGIHAKTNIRCIINGAIIFNLIAFFILITKNLITLGNLHKLIFVIFIVTLVNVFLNVPHEVVEKPIRSKLQRKTLKITSIFLCIAWYYLMTLNIYNYSNEIVSASIYGLMWQNFTLTKFAKKII